MTSKQLPALVCLLLLSEGLACLAAERPERPHIVAHRGLLRHAPENTLANFRACLELRIGFELDVRRSADGHLVCIHDDTVDRTTDGTGKVAELTLAELRRLDAGSWFDPRFRGQRIPTFDQIFRTLARYPPGQVIAVDLKAADVEEPLVRLAEQHGVLDRLLFIGTAIREPRVRERLRKASPKTHVAAVANEAGELEAALKDPFADWVYVRYLPSRRETARIQDAGKRAFIAGPTVAGDEPENWRRAAQSGLDAILTDFPLTLQRQLRE